MTPDDLLARAERALERRRPVEGVWRDCYDHVLAVTPGSGGPALFDGTAADAAEDLAASLLAELTPPWSRWFGLSPVDEAADPSQGAALDAAAETLQGHLDRSNFALEMHQAFLDLVVAGTGVLLVEEAPPGETSAFRFTAVPLREAVLEEGASGRLDTVFRLARLTAAGIASRYPRAVLPPALLRGGDPDAAHRVIEAVWPDRTGHRFCAMLELDGAGTVLAEGRFDQSPFLAFRWLKAPGETYGRGPVMKALPDIRTANKVVELVLKNASIAATGIWMADDDGVLNPATVRLEPGAIIPKAPGSAGLTPLAAPGSFDVSQLVLSDMRARIRSALLADRLSPPRDARMTATEVLERSAETARLLGATYGRLQAELLTPLISRCLSILRRRGEVPPILLDGQEARIAYQSPLARVQGRADASNTLLFLQAVAALGPAAAPVVDIPAAARHLARTLSAPGAILAPPPAASPGPAAGRGPARSPQPGEPSRMTENLLDAAQVGTHPGAHPNPGDARVRPADVPEKFWDPQSGTIRVDTLLKSYRELERKLSARFLPPGADAPEEERTRFRRALGVPETPEEYAIETRHALCGPDPEVNARLHRAGFTPEQVQLVYDLAADRLLPVVAEAAREVEAGRQLDRLHAEFGGEERFRRLSRQIAAWGRANLAPEVFEALSASAEGVIALHRMMEKGEPPIARRGDAPEAMDEAALRKMMRDPRYWRTREPDFVRRVTEGFRRLTGG